MKRLRPPPLKSSAAALSLLISSLHAQVEHVDPTIGGVALMLVPTRPLVHMPNSMLRVYPVQKDQIDLKISSFPLSIVSHRRPPLAENRAALPVPSVKPGILAEPASVVTTPSGVIFRIVLLPQSATMGLPLPSIAMPRGFLNRAALPVPSVLPDAPAVLAKGLTTAAGVIFRMVWLL